MGAFLFQSRKSTVRGQAGGKPNRSATRNRVDRGGVHRVPPRSGSSSPDRHGTLVFPGRSVPVLVFGGFHNMIVIPAVDIQGGKCVRLRQGRMDSTTVFSESPAEQAQRWQDEGARRIHVVDLDGSVEGRPANLDPLKTIVQTCRVPIQVGGGIRDAETVAEYLDIGIDRVILGTIAVKAPDVVLDLLARYPGRIAVGIDARDGRVAVEGWTEATDRDAGSLATVFDPAKPAAYIYTDIERDGMMRGPNISATRAFASGTQTPVILSGGVSTIQDVENAAALEPDGVVGVIIGRALYEGSITLPEANRILERGHAR